MTLYFDTKLQFPDEETISTVADVHLTEPIFAVASYSQDKGGSVTIFNDTGHPFSDINFPLNALSQATALRWHPERKLLVIGWENGDLDVYYDGRRDFASVKGPHKKSPIVIIEFSEKGGRLVTADAMGILIGWRCDSHGQLLTMFTHDLKNPLLHVTFRKTVVSAINTELTNLARAAVAGDQEALDTLTTWRPRTAARNLTHSGVKDNHCFYVGTQTGSLYYVNQGGTCTEVFRSETSPIIQVIWHPSQEAIVCLMDDMTVCQFFVEANGNITEVDRVKFSSTGRTPGHSGCVSWASSSLAIITGDLSVRIWDITTSDNFVLNMTLAEDIDGEKSKATVSEVFSCISYCRSGMTLCAGTNQGRLFTWRKVKSVASDTPEDDWQLTAITKLRGAIKQCAWGVCDVSKPCIFLNCISSCFILKEQPLLSRFSKEMWVSQKSANQLVITHVTGAKTNLTADIPILELCLSDTGHIIISNGHTITIYRVKLETSAIKLSSVITTDSDQKLSISPISSFVVESTLQLFMYDQSIVVLTVNEAKIVSMSGVILHALFFTDMEGKPIGMDLTAHYLTVFSMNGYIKVWDISRHEPKQICPARSAYDLFEHFGEVIQAKSNITGSHMAITIANESLIPNGKLYVWDIEKDKVMVNDFFEDPFQAAFPVNFYWDKNDQRLLACETRYINRDNKKLEDAKKADGQISVMFITENGDFGTLETVDLETAGEKIVDFLTPNLILLKVTTIERITLRDFKGMEQCSDETRKTVLDFSINIALSKMDEAFSCIRSIQSEAVWMNLTKMCVNTGRLDVAKVCLGHLKKARSVRALRKAMKDDSLEPEAKTAVLAIELNMIDEAKQLYRRCGRYDLLNRLCQACGHYDEALEVAQTFDRIHLKNTYYKYAEWLREKGDIQGALKYYEQSSNPTHNITQILMEDPQALKKYMQNTTDLDLLKWWAQYIESTGDMDAAFKIYQKANDWFSQIRILCFLGQLSKADAIAKQSNDRAACYHLARHYESIERFQEAIQFYTRAQTYSNAVRICKENDLQEDLWQVASAARPADKTSAAAYFEECGEYTKAVELYHRSGMLHKAVEMAFASQQPETLQVIAAELDKDSDPELVDRCAEFFISTQQHQKAVALLGKSRQLDQALTVCADKGVPITETLAELLTPAKDEFDEQVQNSILINLGERLQEQGDYHLATKKFTQAGDKVRAMKSLLKSSDTDKIIFFASMSRQKEVYIMAANYLQGLDWQSDPKVLKHIVQFYTKAQSLELLANFYANCAQIEILEYRDYEKAFKALQEAEKCLTKVYIGHHALDNLHHATNDVRRVMELHQFAQQNEYQNVISEAKAILQQNERPPTRQVHVIALLVEALIHKKQHQEALSYLRELILKTPDGEFRNLLDKSLIEKLSFDLGIDFDSIWNVNLKRKESELDGDDEIQEEVE